ncbi:MAG: hypothetical protein AAEF23_00625 [Gammaproteobacteria bacterium]
MSTKCVKICTPRALPTGEIALAIDKDFSAFFTLIEYKFRTNAGLPFSSALTFLALILWGRGFFIIQLSNIKWLLQISQYNFTNILGTPLHKAIVLSADKL